MFTVNREALVRQPAGWLAWWIGQAEESGCVLAGQGRAVADRVLESAPLGLDMPARLLRNDHKRSGSVDVGPENRLEVVTPIRREGADPNAALVAEATVTGTGNSLTVTAKSSPELLGVETAWYAVRAEGIVPVKVEARIQGVLEARAAPARNFFEGMAGRYYRLVYKADETAVFLAAGSRRELEWSSIALRDNPDACGTGSLKCIVVPRFVAVNAYLVVNVNGGEVTVPVGATLQSLVRAAGKRPEDVIQTLAITKPFAGRQVTVEFDRAKADVMDLVLLGHEMVRW